MMFRIICSEKFVFLTLEGTKLIKSKTSPLEVGRFKVVLQSKRSHPAYIHSGVFDCVNIIEKVLKMVRHCWEQVRSSSFARNTHNPIRHIIENLDLEPNPNKPMIALSIGDPTIFGNLKPPIELIQAVKESLDSFRYNGYTSSTGYQEARQAVAEYSSNEYYTVSPEDVILCSGCSCALDICITAVANPGENILIPRPGFSIYKTLAEGLGIKVKEYNLIPEKGWEIDLDQMESLIDSKTVAILINNPSNPCGSVFSERHLRDIVQLASRNYLPIIADEIYEHLVFEGQQFVPIASLSDDVPIISCSGLTKRFLVPGWRMGWIVIHDRNNVLAQEIRGGLLKLSQRILGSTSVVQGALPKILKESHESFFQHTISVIQKHANIAYSLLSDIEGLNPVMPQGAMYMMVGIDMAKFPRFKNGLEFVCQMVSEESVFPLPGECFNYPGYVRIVLTVPEEQLLEACTRIGEFCARHLKCENRKSTLSYQEIPYTLSIEASSTSP